MTTRVPFDRQPVLTGELVTLRPLEPADFDPLYAAAADPLTWAQHPDSERWRPEIFRTYFDDHLASGGALAIQERATGELIGATRYENFDEERSEVEIGWTFLTRSRWGGGYNGDLKETMLTHAFRSVRTVLFLVDPQNMRSRRAVEKLGATETGTRRGLVLYELTEATYRPQDAGGRGLDPRRIRVKPTCQELAPAAWGASRSSERAGSEPRGSSPVATRLIYHPVGGSHPRFTSLHQGIAIRLAAPMISVREGSMSFML